MSSSVGDVSYKKPLRRLFNSLSFHFPNLFNMPGGFLPAHAWSDNNPDILFKIKKQNKTILLVTKKATIK
jgi:hypothetical protein